MNIEFSAKVNGASFGDQGGMGDSIPMTMSSAVSVAEILVLAGSPGIFVSVVQRYVVDCRSPDVPCDDGETSAGL